MNEEMPFDVPQGMSFSVFDHYNRGRFFYANAQVLEKKQSWHEYGWCINAAVYSCQAIYEIIYSHVDNPDNPEGRWHGFIGEYKANVRHYDLIGSYRVQDFHRGAIALLPGCTTMHGPVVLKTSKQRGSSATFLVDEGKKISKTKRNASIKFNRPISTHNTKIEANNGEMLSALDMIKEYLEDLHELLKKRAPTYDWGEGFE